MQRETCIDILVLDKLDLKIEAINTVHGNQYCLEVYIFTQDPGYFLQPRLNPTLFQLQYY